MEYSKHTQHQVNVRIMILLQKVLFCKKKCEKMKQTKVKLFNVLPLPTATQSKQEHQQMCLFLMLYRHAICK